MLGDGNVDEGDGVGDDESNDRDVKDGMVSSFSSRKIEQEPFKKVQFPIFNFDLLFSFLLLMCFRAVR